ncbi:MAG: hypothetical protein M3O15_00600 [Acidobacteriota bacterium]|nr:hypothetical protein [Acidobacteriota bacterium]
MNVMLRSKSGGEPKRCSLQTSLAIAVVAALTLSVGSHGAPLSVAPALYSDPMRESPSRGDPGDVLLIPGWGFKLTPGAISVRVVYQRVDVTTEPLAPVPMPSAVPSVQTPQLGTIVPLSVDESSVSVRLPMVMTAGTSYALWVANPDSKQPQGYDYSNGILINDARPMWLTGTMGLRPGDEKPVPKYPFIFQKAPRPGLGREIKIVGRNLQPAPFNKTLVRFVGPFPACAQPIPKCVPFTLPAATDPYNDGSPATSRYVARLTLPSLIPFGMLGDYAIEVQRDGKSWVPLNGPGLNPSISVVLDPRGRRQYDVSTFGGNPGSVDCTPDGVTDNTLCITRAIESARLHGGGDVRFPPGAWTVNLKCWAWAPAPNQPNYIPNYSSISDQYNGNPNDPVPSYQVCDILWRNQGLVVPNNVNLVGQGWQGGPSQTIIQTGPAFDQSLLTYLATPTSQGGALSPPPAPPLPPAADPCGSPQAKQTYACGDPNADPFQRQTLFTLEGNNIVQGIGFRDTYPSAALALLFPDTPKVYGPGQIGPGSQSLLMFGDNITITGNSFGPENAPYNAVMNTYSAAVDSTFGTDIPQNPRRDIVITHNQFGAFGPPINLGVLGDAAISGNVFTPGAWNDQVAVGVGGSRRVEIAANVLKGDDQAASGPSLLGWRAGFFFPSTTSQEHLLVIANKFTCVGARFGFDGEAIAFDSNQDQIGFISSQNVTHFVAHAPVPANFPSSQDVVTVHPGPGEALLSAPSDSSSKDADGYAGRWLRVVFGQGLGQARKIVSARKMASGDLRLFVSPSFDVAPSAGDLAPPGGLPSRIIVSEQAWQSYVVDNLVDNSCSTGRFIQDHGFGGFVSHWNEGLIGFGGSGADNVIEANSQNKTQGILLTTTYMSPIARTQVSQFFVEIRGNSIRESFGFPLAEPNQHDAYGSGINLTTQVGQVSAGGLAIPGTPDSDEMGFGVTISNNTIRDAALRDPNFQKKYVWAVGVSVDGNWSSESAGMPGYADTLIFGNDIREIQVPQGSPFYPAVVRGVGIANGAQNPNYPKGTVVCENKITVDPAVPQAIADLPPPPPAPAQPSTLTSCTGAVVGIGNGGFESGTLAGWTVAGGVAASSAISHGGSYSAQLGGSGPTSGDSSIVQTFTAPTGTSTLSFWYRNSCPDTVNSDWATAALVDNTTHTTTAVLAKTCTQVAAWAQVTAAVTAGHSYTLILTSHDDNDPANPTYTLFDDVTLQ